MHHADKYSQHSAIIRQIWLNGWVFAYEISSSPAAVTYQNEC